MSEAELRALIQHEIGRFDPEFGTLDQLVERIMDAVSEYASERASDAAYNAMLEAGEDY